MNAKAASSATPEDYERHSKWLRQLARTLVTDAGSADDLVQETWLSWLRSGPSDASVGGSLDRDAARPWLRRVLTNAAKKLYRSDGRRLNRETLAFEDRGPAASAAELAESADLIHALMGEVKGLDGPLRDAVLLRHLHGLSAVEIARRSGEPEGTVRWRLSEARQRLRTRMDERTGSREAWAALTLPFGSDIIGAGTGGASSIAAGKAAGSAWTSAQPLFLWLAAACIASVVGVWLMVRSKAPQDAASHVVATNAAHRASDELRSVSSTEGQRRRGALGRDGMPALPMAGTSEAPTQRLSIDPDQAALTVRLVGPEGEPVEGAVLQQLGNEHSFTMTNAEGNAILVFRPPLKSAPLGFLIEHSGYASSQFSVSVQTGVLTSLGTKTMVGAVRRRGRVVDGEERPVAGATVYVAAADDPEKPKQGRFADAPPLPWDRFGALSVRADHEGRFRFDRAPAAPTRIWATAPGFWYTVTPVVSESPKVPVEVQLKALPQHLTISGRVVDGKGRPLGDILVTITPEGSSEEQAEAETAKDGTFRLLPRTRGRFTVRVEDLLDRYEDASMEAITAGEADVEVRMAVPLDR